jgi:probable phosphoglycerate mutase
MSAKPLVYLVRHGEAAASWGQSADPGLSELGRQQAEEACKSLRDALDASMQTPTPRLISSPLLRARQTAEPLLRSLSMEPVIDERFREIPSPVPLAQRQDWLRGFMGESWSAQGDALQHWRDTILEAIHAVETPTVIFTHFLVINAIVGAMRGEDATLVFWPANCSVTTLAREGTEWTVCEGEVMRSTVN